MDRRDLFKGALAVIVAPLAIIGAMAKPKMGSLFIMGWPHTRGTLRKAIEFAEEIESSTVTNITNIDGGLLLEGYCGQ